MREKILLSVSTLFFLIGCEGAPNEETWHCLQENQISPELIASQKSTVVYSTPQTAKSSGIVTIQNTALNKKSELKSELTFSREDSGKKIKMTLLSADLEVVTDELNLLSEGRAQALLPEVGTSISGEIIYQDGATQRVKYENNEVLECTLQDV
ncbi:hypothetical protein CW735_11260 [Alteromonas sp. MB-3u-76]|jgi:hypothetical protein|uniref:hypothetical protein n=1 Tax=Alteromonas sp. MB-3u-76 TaxID=2058133 RepID=UPI000C30140B|nr:hypothetical protein [Alteromonas sp. MB-3u-76]AUC88687.1 hypothetical protein CW735_11260 [Alteromonas sp. MB-3u-76]